MATKASGLFALLTPTQQKSVIAYTGEDHLDDATGRFEKIPECYPRYGCFLQKKRKMIPCTKRCSFAWISNDLYANIRRAAIHGHEPCSETLRFINSPEMRRVE